MQPSKKVFRAINITMLAAAAACLVYYSDRGGLALKGITSGFFALLGLINLFYVCRRRSEKRAAAWFAAGAMLLTAAADVLLGINFILGTVVFAAGHVFYFAAYCALEAPRKSDLLPIAAVGAVSLFCLLGTPFIRIDDSVMKIVLIGYAVVISCMLGKAIGNLTTRRTRTRILLLIGSCLFWFSDLMLALNLFGSGGKLASALCLCSYWPGQDLLAHTLYHFADDTRE